MAGVTFSTSGRELRKDVFRLGELMRLFLRPDQVAIDRDLERASAGGNQRQLLHRMLLLFENLSRQTDGFVGIVSGYAVLDLDLHRTTF